MALMRNKPLSSTTRAFQRKFTTYHDFKDKKDAPDLWYCMGIDPAGTKGNQSDFFAIVVVGIDHTGRWFVVDKMNERIGHDVKEIVERIFEFVVKWNIRGEGIALETNFFRGVLKDALEEKFRQEGKYVGVKEVKASSANRKDDVILWLQPLWERRRITIGRDMGDLETQLMGWRPGGTSIKYDDLLNALGLVRWVANTPRIERDEKMEVRAGSSKMVMWEIEKMRSQETRESYLRQVTGTAERTKGKCPFVVTKL